jgi:hypothetical protein
MELVGAGPDQPDADTEHPRKPYRQHERPDAGDGQRLERNTKTSGS